MNWASKTTLQFYLYAVFSLQLAFALVGLITLCDGIALPVFGVVSAFVGIATLQLMCAAGALAVGLVLARQKRIARIRAGLPASDRPQTRKAKRLDAIMAPALLLFAGLLLVLRRDPTAQQVVQVVGVLALFVFVSFVLRAPAIAPILLAVAVLSGLATKGLWDRELTDYGLLLAYGVAAPSVFLAVQFFVGRPQLSATRDGGLDEPN